MKEIRQQALGRQRRDIRAPLGHFLDGLEKFGSGRVLEKVAGRPRLKGLRREIRKLQLDVLHSQSPWFLGLLAARSAARFRIPHVSTYHTMYDQYAHYLSFLPAPATQSLLEWWVPEYYNQTDRVIVPSDVAKRSLQGYGVETEITIIPTGVPIPESDALSEQSSRDVRAR